MATVRETIHERAAAVQATRAEGGGVLAQLRAAFRGLDDQVAGDLEAEREADTERLLRDPFRFASWSDFVAYRRKHGLRTPRHDPTEHRRRRL